MTRVSSKRPWRPTRRPWGATRRTWRPALAGRPCARRIRRAIALFVPVCLGTAFVVACGSRSDLSSSELLPVSLPDLSQATDSVREQVREREAALVGRQQESGTRPEDLASAYGDLGLLLFAATFPDHAAAYLENAQRLAPDEPRWAYYLGHLHLARGERREAARAFERAAELEPRNYATRVWLAETHLDDGQAAEAERVFVEAARLQPKLAAAHAGAGRAALARQEYAAAVEHFTKALALDPEASAVHYPLGMAHRGLGDAKMAEVHLRQRGDAWPAMPDPRMDEYHLLVESASAWEGRGRQALASGDWTGAIQAFRQGLELEPENPDLRYALATALMSAGDRRSATGELEETVRRSPAFARAHAALGTMLNVEGRHHEAVDRFQTALRHDPLLVDARVGLAESLRVTGRLDASIPHYERAVALDPRQAAAWLGGGLSLVGLGRIADARDWLTRAERVHPDRPEFAELLARLPEARR